MSSFHSDGPEGRKHRQNALILALDPAAFGDPALFAEQVSATLTALHCLPKSDPDTAIRYPGENSAAVAASRSAQGVPVGPKVWAELEVAADKLGVTPPTPL